MTTNGAIDNRFNHHGSSCDLNPWQWDINNVLKHQINSTIKYAVLILNRPITQNSRFVKEVWNKAAVRMTVDGGARRWETYIGTQSEEERRSLKPPDLVTGDFDSITTEILEEYKKKGYKTIHTPDQNYTDFTKALMQLNIHCNSLETEMDHVLVFGQSSGRLDHIIGNIQTLFLVKSKALINPNTDVYLLTDDGLSWLLNPGEHVIAIPEETRKHKRAWCSLVPIGEPCQYVTSTGLKWNLDNKPLQFGELVSTSNAFDGSQLVTIKCSHTILWSMRVPYVMGS